MGQLEQQMRHRDREMVPRALVQAMFALMIGTTAVVAYAQWADVPNTGVLVEAPVAQSLEVTIVAQGDGTYRVFDPAGAELAASTDDMAGFIGVIGRIVDRDRTVRRLDLAAPVTVVRRENGNIAILDASTEKTIELIGYGADNVAAFARLLD